MAIDTPIRCYVLDDEYPATTLLNSYIKKHPALQLIGSTTNAVNALSILHEENIALLFLDIEMPQLNGIELLRSIEGKNIQVIITTAFKEYALDGYEYNVVDYLLKPVTYPLFERATERALERIHTIGLHDCSGQLFVKVAHQFQKISFRDILYIESLGDYVAFHTTTAKLVSLDSLKQLQEKLPSQYFIRIHRSYIINQKFISGMKAGNILIGKTQLPVGATYREEVRRLF